MYPNDNFVATFAIGYPVAFDANADDLDTLGFISIIAYSKEFGFSANCTLQPPTIPISFIIFIYDWFLIVFLWGKRVRSDASLFLCP